MLLRFLHDFGLPWLLYLRNGIRANNAGRVDFMWNLCLPWFRATGKFNYAAMCVNVGQLNHMMGPVFREVWDTYRTASFLGRSGRNVAWDYVLERMNRDFKQHLSAAVTNARLNEFATMMNGLKHARDMVSAAWGLDKFNDEYEYTHVLEADVANLVHEMKASLGRTVREVEQNGDRDTNPFNTNARATIMPWTRVQDSKVDLETYIRSHCTMAVR
jgi:hypothetical protein